MKKKITSPFLRIAVLLLALVLVADVCVPGFAVFAEDNTSTGGEVTTIVEEGTTGDGTTVDNTSTDGDDTLALNADPEQTPADPEETPADPEQTPAQPEETPVEQPISCQEGCEGENCTLEGCPCACHLKDNTSIDGEDKADTAENPEEEIPEESEDEIPEEDTADPVQELFDRLMACETLEEINAILYPETEEEQAAVDTLIEQFSEEQKAALSAKMEQWGAYDVNTMELGPYTVAIGSTLKVEASVKNQMAESFSYTVAPSVSGITCTRRDQRGSLSGYTFKIDNSVPDGTYTVSVRWKYKQLEEKWVNDTVAITVISNPVNASVFFLKSPTGDPSNNNTATWGAEIITATINKRGATYKVLDGYGAKNCFDPATYILTMPDGMVKQDDGSYLLPKEKYNTAWKTIYETYKDTWKSANGGKELKESDIEGIYLKPYKLSQNNVVESGYTYPDHIDCTVSVKIKGQYLARFWVTTPGAGQPTLVDSATYNKDQNVEKTIKAPTDANGSYPQTITTSDGKTYVFDGWYNEENEKIADDKWDYKPTAIELADGAVDFYARYVPQAVTLTIKKVTTGNMADYNREFQFTVTGSSITESNKTFKLKNGGEETITVNIGDTITITEENTAYEESWAIKDGANGNNNSATITNIQEDTVIVFTNTLDLATPDTGITLDLAPYIILLAVVSVGFVLMVGKKRYI